MSVRTFNSKIKIYVTESTLLTRVPYVLIWQSAFRAYVLTCKRALRTYVLMCQRVLRAYVLTC